MKKLSLRIAGVLGIALLVAGILILNAQETTSAEARAALLTILAVGGLINLCLSGGRLVGAMWIIIIGIAVYGWYGAAEYPIVLRCVAIAGMGPLGWVHAVTLITGRHPLAPETVSTTSN